MPREIFYPAEPFGLDRKYDLPRPEPELEEMLVGRFEDEELVGRIYDEVRERNPGLPEVTETQDKYDVVLGATSRLPLSDIEYFVRIGGGTNQNRLERRNHVTLSRAAEKTMCWVTGPRTQLRLLGEVGGLLRKIKVGFSIARAYIRRRLGIGESAWNDDPDLRTTLDLSAAELVCED